MPTIDGSLHRAKRDLLALLGEFPVTVPALGAIALFVAWAANQGGYPLTHWAPGGLIVLALLVITLICVPLASAEISTPVRVAVWSLAAYTALSYCSILWAAVPADALEGATRTLLYLLVFCLFALWPRSGASVALALSAWTLALIALGVFVTLHIDTAAGLGRLFLGGRLTYPSGYPNANAAQWLMAFWPAVLLARSERLAFWLRGLLAGGAVLLADLALLSQSRGSLYSTAAMLIIVFVLLAGRLRTFAVLVPVAAAVGLTAPAVLRVDELLEAGHRASGAVHTASAQMLLGAFVVAALAAGAAALESRGPSVGARRRARRLLSVTASGVLLAVLVGGLVVGGNPLTRVEHAWDTFKGGYSTDTLSGGRLLSGLGSNRYDFYRVAVDEFLAHPLVGIGADNFAQPYLRHGHSAETPHYPHSVELRTLTQTGLLGALLALLGLGAALFAAARSLKSPQRLESMAAAAALAGFLYWLVHGSVDWFWEYAGLGAPAFALLGMACAHRPKNSDWSFRSRSLTPRVPLALALGLLTIAAAVVFTAPWLSQLEVQRAGKIWARAPSTAYADLDSAEPYLIAGSIALRLGDLTRADHEFALALRRSSANAYATLERAAIASATGQRSRALVLFTRALELDPRDPLIRGALRVVRGRGKVDILQLNRSILQNAQEFA
jgi:tetratricopeptide (TPR) repeat protein